MLLRSQPGSRRCTEREYTDRPDHGIRAGFGALPVYDRLGMLFIRGIDVAAQIFGRAGGRAVQQIVAAGIAQPEHAEYDKQ